MRPREIRLLVVLAAVVISAAILRTAPRPATAAQGAGAQLPAPTAASRARGLRFAGVAPADQAVVLAAVASAQPQARRLIGEVAGLATVRVGPAGPNASGFTQSTASGYDVQLDLGPVSRVLGTKGVERVVLHELGHVVRFAIVPPALLSQLDAGIPGGFGCGGGVEGACAPAEERFAETFAKWAMNDIGASIDIGYRIPPPGAGLDAWAVPLTRLP